MSSESSTLPVTNWVPLAKGKLGTQPTIAPRTWSRIDWRSSAASAKRHGDAAISLVMAVRASYMEGGEIAFTALPRHSRGFDNVQDHNNDIELPEPSAW